VIGLVLAGSTADQSHAPDEWSDHDFFVITQPGAQEAFRTGFAWLPDHEDIVLTIRETAHGLKVLYANGHLLEYAAFDLGELANARANDYAVVFDRGGVADTMRAIATPIVGPASTVADPQRDMGMFLCLLVVGTGRVARGEFISGQVFIRTYALGHLLGALAARVPAANAALLDDLDVYRRFERAYPAIGAEVVSALGGDPITTAQRMLAIFERYLATAEGYPAEAVTTTSAFLQRAGNAAR
jgi:hypothetical protein